MKSFARFSALLSSLWLVACNDSGPDADFRDLNKNGSLEFDSTEGPERMHALGNIDQRHLGHFNIGNIPEDLTLFGKWQNALQEYAEKNTRLGIPITIASDPRHHFSTNIYAFSSSGFSQFPETLGLAAIGDIDLIDQFTDIVRQEYVAVGIRLALHPQVDLATEPRWPRINGGFGEDAQLSADIARAYVQGLQGETLSSSGVATMTKHFPGGGPQNEGLDSHFEFQKGQIYPGGRFELPSSMDAVRQQLADVPADSADPLFALGFGLAYE